jgi:hypothetical protein
MDLRALPRRRQFPVAVDVAVPVQPAAEAGRSVGLGEVGEVGFAEPVRQRPVGASVAKKPLAVLDEQRRGRIGKSAPEQGSHRQLNVALELGLGDAGGLKVLPVEIGNATLTQGIEWPAAAPEGWRDAEAGNRGEHIGTEQGGVPGDRRAPVVADDDSLLFAQRFHQRDHVADIVENAVGTDIGGRAGSAKASHVGCDDMKTRRRDCRDLVAPGIG